MANVDVAAEIEAIKSIIGKYFPIYDVRLTHDSLSIFITPDPRTLDQNFESLRRELGARGYIPFLHHQGGEYIIAIARKPEIKRRGTWINQLLLIVTFFSTTFAGAYLWASYKGVSSVLTVDNFLWGAVFFAIPLMTMLGMHELCHYLASKKHGVEASLPYFIPSVPPLGTFGAFISMREPMPDRKALVDIGVAGPIGGLIVAIPLVIIGLYLTAHGEVQSGELGTGGAIAIVVQPLYQFFMLFVPVPEGVALHPTAFAAWVGLLVTAINLLPAGQLDGGHIARGLLGDKSRYLSYATIALLFIMSFFYIGWLFFALLIFLLGLRHPAPLNDISKVDNKRKAIGAAALVILLLTFVPIPVVEIPPDHSYEIVLIEPQSSSVNVTPGQNVVFYMVVNNTGNTYLHLNFVMKQVPQNWSAIIYLSNQSRENATNALEFEIPYKRSANVTVEITVPENAEEGLRTIVLDTSSQSESRTINFQITVNG
ncbi:MAG: site-2 protease family protein [Methanomassiliicoccales archaeon]|jgi:membrane-associated protease RseP (regulator of RpoE activity)|nr:site-2 protease family protein [Methanomassiliicoccales archaeon]